MLPRILPRVGWSLWTLVLLAGAVVGVGGVSESVGSPDDLFWSGCWTVLLVLLLVGRVRVLVAMRRQRHRLAPGEPALANEVTRSAYRERMARTGSFVAGAVVLVLVFAGIFSWSTDRADDLARRGIRNDGKVTEVDLGGARRSAWVRFRFRDEGLTRVERMDVADARGYAVGDDVVVLVHPDDPARFTLAGEEEGEPGWATWVLIVAISGSIGLVVLAWPSLWGWWRTGALLATQPWREARVEYRDIESFRTVRTVLLVDDGDVTEVVGLAWYRESEMAPLLRGRVWVVGAPKVGYVVAPTTGAPLVWATRSALPWRRYRWRRAFQERGRIS